MSATIVSFAQFQESRQRRQPAPQRPGQPVVATPAASTAEQTLPLTLDLPPQPPVDPTPRS